jgi:hypothetical protein
MIGRRLGVCHMYGLAVGVFTGTQVLIGLLPLTTCFAEVKFS